MKTYFLILILMAATSCEVVLTVDPPENPKKLVVNSVFHPDSIFQVTLSNTQGILEDDYRFNRLDNALVTILDEGNNVLAETTRSATGVYHLNIKPEEGKVYRINAVRQGLQAIQAVSTLPRAVAIQELAMETNNSETEVKLTINDPAETKNYYRIVVYSKYEYSYRNSSTNETITQINRSFYDLFEESNDLVSGESKSIFEDTKFNGKAHTFILRGYYSALGPDRPGYKTLELGIMLQSLSEDYYQYLRTTRLQRETQGDPFAQPVQVYNNIQNGHGIFGGYSTSFYSLKK